MGDWYFMQDTETVTKVQIQIQLIDAEYFTLTGWWRKSSGKLLSSREIVWAKILPYEKQPCSMSTSHGKKKNST